MAKDRSLVRASDLGAWAFCNRAWWLREVQGAAHDNPDALERGSESHAAHGRRVQGAARLSTAGLILVATGLIVLALLIAWQLMG